MMVKPAPWVHKGLRDLQVRTAPFPDRKGHKVKPVQWVHKGLPVRTALFPDRRDRKVNRVPLGLPDLQVRTAPFLDRKGHKGLLDQKGPKGRKDLLVQMAHCPEAGWAPTIRTVELTASSLVEIVTPTMETTVSSLEGSKTLRVPLQTGA